MIEAPGLLIEPPDLDAGAGPDSGPRAPGPTGIDVLTDVLRVFRVGGAALLQGDFRAPWSWQAPPAASVGVLLHPDTPPSRFVVFHVVVEGACWVGADDGERCELRAGDLVGFPRGDAHWMGSLDADRGSGTASRAASVSLDALLPPPPWDELPRVSIEGIGDRSRILCFYLRCDELLHNPLLQSLPWMLVARPGDAPSSQWLASNVRYLVREARRPCPGSGCVIARLTELLFIEVLRLHIEQLDAQATGWFAALADRRLARALHAIHSRPAEAWTATSLGRHAGLSRSALVQRFGEVLGISPMRYLADWRMQLGAQVLLSSGTTLASAAERAGYASEEAFSRAFKRYTGESPASWRRRRSEGGVQAPSSPALRALSAAPSGSRRRAGSSLR